MVREQSLRDFAEIALGGSQVVCDGGKGGSGSGDRRSKLGVGVELEDGDGGGDNFELEDGVGIGRGGVGRRSSLEGSGGRRKSDVRIIFGFFCGKSFFLRRGCAEF